MPYDCLAVYVRERTILKARYTSGLTSQIFASLEIPVGQGLSGWVVENGKAIINGNPAVEPGYAEASGQLGALNSALSIPLGDGVDQLSGALTLYRTEKDAYSADHLRVLLAIKGDIARAVDGAIRFQKAQRGNWRRRTDRFADQGRAAGVPAGWICRATQAGDGFAGAISMNSAG